MNLKDHMQLRDQTTNLVLRKSALWSLLSLLFYKLILDVSYYFVISPVWSYAKFELHFNIMKLAESYFLLSFLFIFMPRSSKKFSSVMCWLLILLSYIPMLTLFALEDESRVFMYAVSGFWSMVFLLMRTSRMSLPSLKQARMIRLLLFVSLILIVFLMIYKYFRLPLNVDLTKVYEIRAQYVAMEIPFAGYLFNWVGYIVNPILFALFYIKRKWIFAALIVALQFLLFSSTGNKTFLFAIPFALFLMWIIARKNPLVCMTVGFVGVILIGMLSYCLVNDVWISSLFIRRTLLVPAKLSFLYYDFFSKNEFVFLSHSVFRFFLNYPYHLNPPHLIGEVYYNSPKTGANTGIVGDAFMNFGFFGLILWGILLVIILKLIDTFSKGKELKVGIAAIAMPAITLVNSALLTNLLTHGLLLSLGVLYLLPKKR